MHSFEEDIPENIYFAINLTTLSALEPELWSLIAFGGHFGSHLGFVHLGWHEVILVYTVG